MKRIIPALLVALALVAVVPASASAARYLYWAEADQIMFDATNFQANSAAGTQCYNMGVGPATKVGQSRTLSNRYNDFHVTASWWYDYRCTDGHAVGVRYDAGVYENANGTHIIFQGQQWGWVYF